MADVFSQNTASIQTYKLGKTLIQISGGDNLVCQSAQFTYQQTVTPVIPLNADTKYMVVGEATGQGTLSFIIGPSKDVKAFLERYGNACKASNNNTITLYGSDDCNSGSKNKFTLQGVILNQVSTQVSRGQGADLMIATVQFMLNGLEVS